jgi:hypothetical protein
VTQAAKMMESMYSSVEDAMRAGMQQAAAGRPMTDEQRRVLDTLPRRMAQVIREELSWEVMRPGMVQIYRDTLTQDEVNGLINFGIYLDKTLFKAFVPFRESVETSDNKCLPSTWHLINMLDLGKLIVAERWKIYDHLLCMVWTCAQKISFWTNTGSQRCNHLLANRI